jgi:hypothetical protein
MKLGLNVSIRPIRVADKGVRGGLDSRVLKQKNLPFRRWATKQKFIVWFEPQPKHIKLAKRLGCKNIVVLSKLPMQASAPEYLDHCEYVLTPTEYMAENLRSLWKYSNIHGIPWDVGLPIMHKNCRVDPDHLWLYVPVQSGAASEFGSSIFFAIQFLLEEREDLKVTVAYSKRLNRLASEALSDISRRFGDRIVKLCKPTYQKRLASYTNHDWTFWAYRCDDSGVVPLESLCSGTPVVTFSSGPIAEVVEHTRNGHLIDVPLSGDVNGLPLVVDISPKSMIDGLQASVLDSSVLHRLHRHAWPELESRRRTFQAVWKMMWELR